MNRPLKKARCYLLFLLLVLPVHFVAAQSTPAQDVYTYKEGDPNGIGKWYMGREISYVMGHQATDWLERPERQQEENTTRLLQNMDIRPGDAIVDIGAGSGYHVFKMAPMTPEGFIYAVDIQLEMLAAISKKIKETGNKNIVVVRGSETNVNLLENLVDKVLLVDVYHEFSHPVEMMASIRKALKPDGKLFLIEYRGEDETVPIKQIHKMTKRQAVKEMKAAGMKLEKNIRNLPWQHCLVFIKEQP